MHTLKTLERLNRDAAEAARIVEKHGANPALDEARERVLAQDIKEAQARLQNTQVA